MDKVAYRSNAKTRKIDNNFFDTSNENNEHKYKILDLTLYETMTFLLFCDVIHKCIKTP